ncbi:MAG: hypothetical protein LUC31_00950 [Coprobacillus sp.]|nr:hypothetical protein [Coprobacillus sp.]
MKKKFLCLVVAALGCTMVLGSCQMMTGLEKDIEVTLMDRGEYVGTYVVNTFNNAVVPEPTADGLKFVGWSVIDNWTEGVDSEDLLSANTGLIRYDDVKDHLAKKSREITLYSAWTEIYQRDLVLAWYGRTNTSGLDQDYMDSFVGDMYNWLEEEGYDPYSMDIVIREYTGDVGTTCAAIRKDGDVDIMFGWSSTSNLVGTGGMVEGVDILENHTGIAIGDKSRGCARLSDRPFSNKVYYWIFDYYGIPIENQSAGTEEEPQIINYDLWIAWYAKSDTSGIYQEDIDAFSAALDNYLTSAGYNVYIGYRGYDGDVATTCEAIRTDGDIDIMLGWGGNISSTGGMTLDIDYYEHLSGYYIGSTSRYITRCSDTELCNVVWNWIKDNYNQPPVSDDDDGDTKDEGEASQHDLKIAWYAKSETSGIYQSDIDAFSTNLDSYLATSEYVGSVIEYKGYEGDVATSCGAIKTDGDVDIMLGWANNISSTGGMNQGTDFIENISGYYIGSTSRYIARLTDTALCNFVWEWIKGNYSTAPTSLIYFNNYATEVNAYVA